MMDMDPECEWAWRTAHHGLNANDIEVQNAVVALRKNYRAVVGPVRYARSFVEGTNDYLDRFKAERREFKRLFVEQYSEDKEYREFYQAIYVEQVDPNVYYERLEARA